MYPAGVSGKSVVGRKWPPEGGRKSPSFNDMKPTVQKKPEVKMHSQKGFLVHSNQKNEPQNLSWMDELKQRRNQTASSSVPAAKGKTESSTKVDVGATLQKFQPQDVNGKPAISNKKPDFIVKQPHAKFNKQLNENCPNDTTPSWDKSKASKAENKPDIPGKKICSNATQKENKINTFPSWVKPSSPHRDPALISPLLNKSSPTASNSSPSRESLSVKARADWGKSSSVSNNEASRRSSYEEETSPGRAEKNSFLQHKIGSGSSCSTRRKRPLPIDVINKPAPPKPRKPAEAKLPGRGNIGRSTKTRNASFLVKQKESSSAPPPPPPPSAAKPTLSTSSPLRKASTTRKELLLLPPNKIDDDTSHSVPPLQHPMNGRPPISLPKRDSTLTEEIPTWDDEEDENVYDETPDSIPRGFPVINQAGSFPEISSNHEIGEMYEDLDQYQKFERMQGDQHQLSATSRKIDINRSGSERMRKKFKLPKDGDIIAETMGVAKAVSKGGLLNKNQLPVNLNEKIEIIRTDDNPKGKWLARNMHGIYGYVDSDKIQTDFVRQTSPSANNKYPTIAIGQSLPTDSPQYSVPPNDEQVYDETANEDLYEEL